MKVKLTFNVSKRHMDNLLSKITSRELKSALREELGYDFGYVSLEKGGTVTAKITNLKVEVSE